MNESGGILVAGIGSMCRCDDAAGIIIARKLASRAPRGIDIAESSGDGSVLMELWRGRETVIVAGAIASDARPGTIYRFVANGAGGPNGAERTSSAERAGGAGADEIPAGFFIPPDAFGLGEAVELGRALDDLPPRLIIYGVRGKNFGHGIGISERVMAAADRVVEYILEDIEVLREFTPAEADAGRGD